MRSQTLNNVNTQYCYIELVYNNRWNDSKMLRSPRNIYSDDKAVDGGGGGAQNTGVRDQAMLHMFLYFSIVS